jgi:cell filamentation protein
MTGEYSYIDPDYTCTDPKTGVMRNREGIDDRRLLLAFESLKVSARLEQLQARPVRIKNAETLLDIHRRLFQDVSKSFAGSKNCSTFADW